MILACSSSSLAPSRFDFCRVFGIEAVQKGVDIPQAPAIEYDAIFREEAVLTPWSVPPNVGKDIVGFSIDAPPHLRRFV
jgi:hypothetical protein